ncbi:hypothetical protein Aperf_G00000103415 [Anoplocephala perfoliata]
MLRAGLLGRNAALATRGTFCRATSTRQLTEDTNFPEPKFSPPRSSRVYGCGVVVTGAIGIKKYVEPEDKSVAKPKFNVPAPTHIKYFSDKGIDVKSISCGYGFTLFIGTHPKLKRVFYGCGLNSDGQLGYQTSRLHGILSDTINVDIVPEPRIIMMPYHEDVIPIAASCGRAHAFLVFHYMKENKSVLFSMGNNSCGQCARQMIENEIFTPENAQVLRVNLPKGLRVIKQVECGQDHSLVLSSEGEVYAAGLSTDGQTGVGTTHSLDALTKVEGSLKGLKVM